MSEKVDVVAVMMSVVGVSTGRCSKRLAIAANLVAELLKADKEYDRTREAYMAHEKEDETASTWLAFEDARIRRAAAIAACTPGEAT